MTRRRKFGIVIAAVLVLGIAGLVMLPSGPAEPSYQGKSLSQWLAHYNSFYATKAPTVWIYHRFGSAPDAQLAECEDAIRHIGTNGIPVLVQMLKSRDSRIKSAIVARLNGQHIIHIHIATAAERRRMAADAFDVLGADAKSAVPDLAQMLAQSDPPDRIEIGESLTKILPLTPHAHQSGYINSSPNRLSDPSKPTYELPRDELLKALGPPTIRHDKWTAYDLGNIGLTNNRLYLCIEFSTNRILDTSVILSTNANIASPIVR